MHLTFALLGISICAVWLPSIRLGHRAALPPWTALFALAVVLGVISNVLAWPAVLALTLLAAMTLASTHAQAQLARTLSLWASALIALAMALHALPGFNHPKLYDGVEFSPESIPFTSYLSFDKGAAGLFLLAAFSPRIRSLGDAKSFATPLLWVIVVGTPAVVLTIALITGSIRPDPKFPALAWAFIASNLLITCVAEEVFFRGLIQERLTRLLGSRLHGVPILVSTVLFALAHWGGGPMYLMLVAVAGMGYSLAYAAVRRIEAAILAHFVLNLVHFLFFTYPLAAR